MTEDKYSAVWVSHSSISDFLRCPRAYYLKNVYRDPKTGHKIQLMRPHLALGQVVHRVIESLSVLPTESRVDESLINKFEDEWPKVAGKKGGFLSARQEQKFKDRGKEMLRRVYQNPGPLKNRAVKIKMELPHYWLSQKDNIILCGKIDWLEYLPQVDGVHIIDFKTGQSHEDEDSLQLPIYHLLASNCQKHPVERASYWYIDRHTVPTAVELPNPRETSEKVLAVAKKIKLARQLERFKCPHGGCAACTPFERVIGGEAELVGVDEFDRDIYILAAPLDEAQGQSVIL
jgi:CRISPR/Cas system-associated exonuclease Cas4 (RecB family)